jgi:hypothetical protein
LNFIVLVDALGVSRLKAPQIAWGEQSRLALARPNKQPLHWRVKFFQ